MANFSMNGRMGAHLEDGESSDSDHRRKRRKMGQNPQQAEATSAASSATKPTGFAAKMMAKMGYVEGQGLGAAGRGRLAPVETQLRPTGAGLGAVREKTKQAKDDEKREAAFRGEVLEDSEEEEKKRRKELKKKRLSGVGAAASTPTKQKIKYRTAAEIEAMSEGLEVPNVLKSIIDATGSETKLLTSTAGLMSTHNAMVPGETESMKIAKRARRDLESFAEEWNTVSERKKFYEMQEAQLIQEMDELEGGTRGLENVMKAIRDIQVAGSDITIDQVAWESTVEALENLDREYVDKVDSSVLQEVAVAAIHPLFKKAMHDWRPLEDPTNVSSYLSRLSHLFGIQPFSTGTHLALPSDPLLYSSRPSKSTTPYETMLYTLFLPPIRSAITNDWDPTDPTPLLSLIQTWSTILPAFILTGLTHSVIPTRLETLLSAWKSSKPLSERHPQPSPYTYIFPWLPFLPPHHLSPTSPTGLFSTLKGKLKSLFQSYPLTHPPPNTLTSLLPVLPPSFLHSLQTRHLLPRLATHLSENLLIDPSNQDLAPLTESLAWLTPPWSLSTTTTAHLLTAEFFPKWHHILYLWLTNNPNYDEIREWFLWWKDQFPESLRDHDIVAKEWTKGLETISLALDLGPENVATQLPPPETGPVKPLGLSSAAAAQQVKQQQQQSHSTQRFQDEPVTFRHVLETWCTEHSLLFIPMREADPASGLPLFRLTASATGKGGVVVFLRGDVVWVRDGKKREGAGFKPVGLDERLLERAEGR
ncbi:MAG: hypothetical protein L6R36_007628 [Xanthoria steineri]|nr:MAG: hypothetical protein L6R36_007628 [Xanthoria steineri]